MWKYFVQISREGANSIQKQSSENFANNFDWPLNEQKTVTTQK